MVRFLSKLKLQQKYALFAGIVMEKQSQFLMMVMDTINVPFATTKVFLIMQKEKPTRSNKMILLIKSLQSMSNIIIYVIKMVGFNLYVKEAAYCLFCFSL